MSVFACSVVNSPEDPLPAESDNVGTEEGCPEGFSACDGRCVLTDNDPANCGTCGNACADGEVCGQGLCLLGCTEGQMDCNGSCVDLQSDLMNCGTCDNVCPTDGATTTCTAGFCVFECNDGFADCDTDPSNACEVNMNIDATNCGECAKNCIALGNADPACTDGVCVLGACKAGFDNCDGVAANGCELPTGFSATNCGGCNVPCNAPDSCFNGSCQGATSYSRTFTNGAAPPAAHCTAWDTFRGTLTEVAYAGVTLQGNNAPDATRCLQAAEATQICQALNSGDDLTIECDGREWTTGDCGGTELSIDGDCTCVAPQGLRPCIGNSNWGGLETTCGGASQTIEVICHHN